MQSKLRWRGPVLLTWLLGATLATAHAQDAGIEMENCELRVPGTPLTAVAQCGYYTVPENPAEPDGRQIDLHVARVPARGRVNEPDPLVFFAGGPGQAATETWPVLGHALYRVTDSRDVILVDQRGTGLSNPLDCPQMSLEDMLAADIEDLGPATRECLAGLDGDPRFYTTTIAMQDMDVVLQAMGYEQVNLLGVSYGTRAAQVYLRMFPERVRSVVLDSVVPQTLILGSEHGMKLDQAIERVLWGCEADADCRAAFPGTHDKLRNLIAYAEEQAPEVTINHPNTGKPVNMPFDRDVLASALRFLSYSADTQALLPLLIFEAATENRFDRITSQMLLATAGLAEGLSRGMEMSVMCAEDYPFFPDASGQDRYLLGDAMFEAIETQCQIWPRGEVPDGFHDPIQSDVPVLLLSGEYDPVTPPEYADQAMTRLGNATHLVAPGQGHSVTGRGCMGRLVSEFIAAADASELDTACLNDMMPSPYFLDLTGPKP